MCGIAGSISATLRADLEEIVQKIARSQVARGPDALVVKAYTSGSSNIVLAHNRLSIIDLSTSANQPMTDDDGEYTIVFNGEIYNYIELRAELIASGVKFNTKSDTEVILASYRMWGPGAFSRLFGMFAICIYDHRAGSITLVRDRFGVKPLYYWSDGKALIFASTPRQLARSVGLAPNLDYVDRGLRSKYYEDDSEDSPYSGIKALTPGTALVTDVSRSALLTRTFQYYDLSARVRENSATGRGRTFADARDHLTSLLHDACKLRLRSDVPVGLSLSSGLDSTSIAGVVSGLGQNALSYCFGSPDDPSSEGPAAANFARTKNIEPRWIWPTSKGEVADLFWRTLDAQQAPFPGASIMAQFGVFEAARADGTKVVLGGQAADEVFMGYRKFYMFHAQSILRRRAYREMPGLALSFMPFVSGVASQAGLFWSQRNRYIRNGGIETQLRLGGGRPLESQGLADGQSVLDRQILDITKYSLPTLLRYEDRNSMGNSVESRLPFIDHRLVEFGLSLPESFNLSNGYGKWILRSAMKDVVPDRIRLSREKRGFDVKQRDWIDWGLGQTFRDGLRERRGRLGDFLPVGGEIDTLFSDHRLTTDPQAFGEAVSLIWLGDQL